MLDFSIEMALPYATDDLPGIGGKLRAKSEHFVVEEIPLYEPQGSGQHLYINITRTGLTTKEVEAACARLFSLKRSQIGHAGLKDKNARTTQTFSLDLGVQPGIADEAVAARLSDAVGVQVNWVRRHRNKLKTGHLLGNRFEIVVSEPDCSAEECLARCHRIAERLIAQGLPNYFGPQRMGREGANVAQGLAILQGSLKKRDKWLRQFLVSSVQSYLCNRYLAERVGMGAFDRLLAGDVAKKYATGGLFDVVDLDQEQPRYQAQEISFTAPLFGPAMWAAQAEAGALEDKVLAQSGLTVEDFGRARVNGTRRLGRLLVTDLEVHSHAEGVLVRFSLTKSAYATTVLRELMKADAALDGVEESAEDL